MVSLGTLFYTRRKGELVGQDTFGNSYYQERGTPALARRKRWVVYQGDVEASRVPADWHAWLHYTSDEVPPKAGYDRLPWMKPHEPNRTGTDLAYRPPGHALSPEHGARAGAASGDYHAWKPE